MTSGRASVTNDGPISPPPVTDEGFDHLPPHVSNGVIGLRVPAIPLFGGLAMLNGLVSRHPVLKIEASPQAPYPLGGDIAVGNVWLSAERHRAKTREQRYDFSCGELHSHFIVELDDVRAHVNVLTFTSRTHPSLVLQETSVIVEQACHLTLVGRIDVVDVPGRVLERFVEVPGAGDKPADGCIRYESVGGLSTCGAAYGTELVGSDSATRAKADWHGAGNLSTSYEFDAVPGRTYRLRQIASLVPSINHHLPDLHAARLVVAGCDLGFEELRRRNRAEWEELWKGRIRLIGAPTRWQAMADAAFYYLQSAVHASSVASTSPFGMARWHDYHYYYGHVMWDIEAFVVPPLLLTQPESAFAILDFRTRALGVARANADMHGRRGAQFPWEAGPRGDESAPGGGLAAIYEDHISPVVATAFAQYADATDDDWFRRDHAWPVMAAVAQWVTSRVAKTSRGYEIDRVNGVAERQEPANNNAFVNMGASTVLRRACELAESLGFPYPKVWEEVAAGLVLPIVDGVIVDHDDFDPNEEKAATPAAPAGLLLFGYDVPAGTEQATLRYYLDRSDEYVGSPMLSSLYGVWAARLGDRDRSADLFEEGYAKFWCERFHNTHEYRRDRFPDEPVAGPFSANLGGFLLSCLYGLPRIRIGEGPPSSWCQQGPLVMPAGWDGIEVDRVWAQGRAHRLSAHHGDERATLQPIDAT